MKSIKLKMCYVLVVVLSASLTVAFLFVVMRPNKTYNKDTLYVILLAKANDKLRNNEITEAETILKRAMSIDSNRYEAYLNIGDIFLFKGETNKAILNYELALTYCGSSPTNVMTIKEQMTERPFIFHKIQQLRKENGVAQ